MVTQLLRIYHGLIWQASSEYEAEDIRNVMGSISPDILVAPDLLSVVPVVGKVDSGIEKDKDRGKRLHLVFLSRISQEEPGLSAHDFVKGGCTARFVNLWPNGSA